MYGYIVDFVCIDKKLIIELDGSQHSDLLQVNYDEKRTKELEAAGYKILRLWNNEVLSNITGVVELILTTLKA